MFAWIDKIKDYDRIKGENMRLQSELQSEREDKEHALDLAQQAQDSARQWQKECQEARAECERLRAALDEAQRLELSYNMGNGRWEPVHGSIKDICKYVPLAVPVEVERK